MPSRDCWQRCCAEADRSDAKLVLRLWLTLQTVDLQKACSPLRVCCTEQAATEAVSGGKNVLAGPASQVQEGVAAESQTQALTGLWKGSFSLSLCSRLLEVAMTQHRSDSATNAWE